MRSASIFFASLSSHARSRPWNLDSSIPQKAIAITGICRHRRIGTWFSLRPAIDWQAEALQAKNETIQVAKELTGMSKELTGMSKELTGMVGKAGALELELERKKTELEKSKADLMRHEGCLNMRGVIEYTEDHGALHDFYEHKSPPIGRAKRWAAYLSDDKQKPLVACLRKSRKQGIPDMGEYIASIYGRLSERIHAHDPSARVVKISGDIPGDRRALVCLCEHYSYPYVVEGSGKAAVDGSDDEEKDGEQDVAQQQGGRQQGGNKA